MTINLNTQSQTLKSPTVKTCYNCGHTGADVVMSYEHIGGQGDMAVQQCENLSECWQRRDEKDGY